MSINYCYLSDPIEVLCNISFSLSYYRVKVYFYEKGYTTKDRSV